MCILELRRQYYASYLSTSPNVISIGGTTLNVQANTTTTPIYSRIAEPIWTQEGCGYSSIFSQPSYQSGISILNGKPRSIPNCSLVADPNLGCIVYCYPNYYNVGGTSLSCPIFASLISLANQQRLNASKSILTITQIQTSIYSGTSGLFYDVTLGVGGLAPYNNGNVFGALTCFDVPSGQGVPNFNNLITYLANL